MTGEQRLHNNLLDLARNIADREFSYREEIARLKNEIWRKTNPDSPFQSPYINVIGRRHVHGIRYVD